MPRHHLYFRTEWYNFNFLKYLCVQFINCHTSDRSWSVWSVWSVWYIPTSWSRSSRTDRFLIYDLVHHVAAWERYNLHDIGQLSWVEYVIHTLCTTSHNGRLGSIDDLDRDLSVRRVQIFHRIADFLPREQTTIFRCKLKLWPRFWLPKASICPQTQQRTHMIRYMTHIYIYLHSAQTSA